MCESFSVVSVLSTVKHMKIVISGQVRILIFFFFFFTLDPPPLKKMDLGLFLPSMYFFSSFLLSFFKAFIFYYLFFSLGFIHRKCTLQVEYKSYVFRYSETFLNFRLFFFENLERHYVKIKEKKKSPSKKILLN